MQRQFHAEYWANLFDCFDFQLLFGFAQARVKTGNVMGGRLGSDLKIAFLKVKFANGCRFRVIETK